MRKLIYIIIFLLIIISCGKIGVISNIEKESFFVTSFVVDKGKFIVFFSEKIDTDLAKKYLNIYQGEKIKIIARSKSITFEQIPEFVAISKNLTNFLGNKLDKNYFFTPEDNSKEYVEIYNIPDSITLKFVMTKKNTKFIADIDTSYIKIPFSKGDSINVLIFYDKNNNNKLDDKELFYEKKFTEGKKYYSLKLEEACIAPAKLVKKSIIDNETFKLEFDKPIKKIKIGEIYPSIKNYKEFIDKNNVYFYTEMALKDSTKYKITNLKIYAMNDSLTQIDSLTIEAINLKEAEEFKLLKIDNIKNNIIYQNPPTIKLIFNKPLDDKQIIKIQNGKNDLKYKIEINNNELTLIFDNKFQYFTNYSLNIPKVVSINGKIIGNIKIDFVVVK